VFARWRQCVLSWGQIGATWRIRLNLCILRPIWVHNQNGKSIGSDVFAQLTTENAYTLQWAPLSTRIAPFHGGSRLPSNTRFLGPMQADNPNGTSIASAVFAQMTPECLYFTMVRLFPPQNCPFPWGIWAPCNTWFIGPNRILNPNGNSIASAVFAGSIVWQTDRPTDRPTDHSRSITIDRCTYVVLRCGVIMRNLCGIRRSHTLVSC